MKINRTLVTVILFLLALAAFAAAAKVGGHGSTFYGFSSGG
jgi:hypothetical protein